MKTSTDNTLPDPEEIRRQVQARIDAERALHPTSPEPKDITSEFIEDCLNRNELGDGALFAEMFRDRFVFDATGGCWLRWQGHLWERDLTGRALAAVEDVALRYSKEAGALYRQLACIQDDEKAAATKAKVKKINRRLDRLRSVPGREKALKMAATLPDGALVVTGDQLDADPWLLACQNGVIDLRTGACRPGKPSQYLTKAAQTEWHGFDAPAPTWEKFILEVVDGDQDAADYLRRLMGYSITGSIREHIFVIFCGSGRNGKGTLIETLQKILGPLAVPIPPEMLLDQGRVRSSSGASADIMALQGRRICFASETDQGRKFSAAAVKRLSGGDTLTGRNPYGHAQITFPPSHLLILATNHKPKASAEDPAFWARMHLVEFPLAFVDQPLAPNERQIDRTLDEKLIAEAPGILAWLVRGAVEWQQQGLSPPKAITEATAEYRRSEDFLSDFLEDKCVIAEGSELTAKAAYAAFKEWYTENISDKVPSQKGFGNMMGKRFKKEKGGALNTVRYFGVELSHPL